MAFTTTSRASHSRYRHWVALVVCLSAFSLVAHLTHRFEQKSHAARTAVTCGCPLEGWQCLERDALHWAAPQPQVMPLVAAAEPFVDAGEQAPLPRIDLEDTLYSRPPPSC
jgi:hypothetical protein